MTDSRYTVASGLLFLSAALHLVPLVLAFSTQALPMLIAIVLWSLLGLGLRRGMRWVAWIAFLAMALVGMPASLSSAMALFGVVSWAFWAIFAIDLAAAVILFMILWAAKAPKPA